MTWSDGLEFVTSPAVLGWLALLSVWAWFYFTRAKPKWAEFGDIWYGIFNAIEKAIPDESPNKGLNKLNLFLARACAEYVKRKGQAAPESFIDFAKAQAERLVYTKNALSGKL